MYVSLSRLRIPAHASEELIEAFRRRAHMVDDAPGFVDLQVWRSDRDAGEILMVSRWQDREAFKTYMKSPEHQISHERIDPQLHGLIKLEALEHLHTYDVVAE